MFPGREDLFDLECFLSSCAAQLLSISFVRSKIPCLEQKFFSSVKSAMHRPPTFFHQQHMLLHLKALIYARVLVPPPIPTHKQSSPSILYIHMLYTREWINNAIGKLLKGEINHHSQLASHDAVTSLCLNEIRPFCVT